jgi:hypothetical protein
MIPRTRRLTLFAVAALFFAYEQWAFYTWMQQHGSVSTGLAHAWMTLRQDPMVFMAWNDMGVFTVLVLVWLMRDLRAHGRAIWWWPVTLIMGCPPLLVYLATRTDASHHAVTPESGPRAARAR